MRTDLDVFKWKMLRGSFLRRLILKAMAFGCVMLFISISQIAHEVSEVVEPLVMLDECPLNFGSNLCYNLTEFSKPMSLFGFPLFKGSKLPCEATKGLAKNVFTVLMDKKLLDSKANVLCVGAGSASALLAMKELGFSNAYSINRHPFFSLLRRRFVYELDFVDGYFDFVFSKAVDKVSVPALLVLEMERVLRPGGIGAMLVGARDLYTGNMIRSATTVSSFLKSSDIVYACGVDSFTLVIFEKRFPEVSLFEHYQLPKECPSITNNKPYMTHIEPLVAGKSTEFERDVNYLPRFMDISSRNMLIYVNIGVKETTNLNTTKLFQPYKSIRDRDYNVFLIDHNASVLSSHVKNPGISFIYHPALSNSNGRGAQGLEFDEYMDDDDVEEEGFDLAHWFEETVKDNDFVVLRINGERVKYDILGELFITGAICRVDELFLHCSETTMDCKGGSCGDCSTLLKSLRNVGVFVHQWTGD